MTSVVSEEKSLPSLRPKTFTDMVRQRDGSVLYRVRSWDHHGRPCWFLLRASDFSLIRLNRTLCKDIIDLTAYGEVVDSGWGHELPQDLDN